MTMSSESAWLRDLRGKGLRKGDIRYKRISEPLRGSEGHMPSCPGTARRPTDATLGRFPIGRNFAFLGKGYFYNPLINNSS